MTNQAQIQSHINKGFGIAAKILGVPYQQYRATVPTEPAISPQTLIGSLNAGFDVVATFPFEKPK